MKENKKISLFINSATKALQIGLLYGENAYRVDLPDPKKALESLHLGMQKLFDEASISLKDVDSFYLLLGPGSNTGIRLGLTIPRTIYAFNPNIELFGIPTLDLFMSLSDHAALSDRNGNLYYGSKDDGETSFVRIDREDIPSIKDGKIVIESKDVLTKEELKGRDVIEIDVLDLMMKEKDRFRNYSSMEEDYLPEYLLKI